MAKVLRVVVGYKSSGKLASRGVRQLVEMSTRETKVGSWRRAGPISRNLHHKSSPDSAVEILHFVE